jgi:imidazolonepropionase-like amidohydrolase
MTPAQDMPGDTVFTDDLDHCTILPPLVDSAMALARSPSISTKREAPDAESAATPATVARHLRYCHGHGVLGMADYSDDPGLEAVLQDAIDQQVVVDVKRAGQDFIRIRLSEDIDDSETAQSLADSDELARIIAGKGNKKVIAVANGRHRVGEALAAGCDGVEQGYAMGEDNLRLMAEGKILWIPSVVRAKNALSGSASGGSVCCRFSLRYVAPGKAVPGAEEMWKKVLAAQLADLGRARELGVPTAVGTGAGGMGILHGESMAEEMKLFLKAGYSLEETIRCATENGACFFGMQGLGALTVGGRANFLVVRGTLKQLPRKLSYLEAMYLDGVPSPGYSKM